MSAGEEDFIPLGGEGEDITFEEASDEESDESFDPSEMSLATFHKLLDCYPTTVEKVYRQKAINKVVPQPTKGEKKRAQRAANTTEPVFKKPSDDDLDKSQRKYVDSEMDKFLQLNRWRFEEFPAVMKERAAGEGRYLGKDEIIKVMDWKTKHGLPRPTLLGMLKTNKEKVIRTTTADAFKALPTSTDENDLGASYPKTSLDTLSNPLRGIGPATASLILSIATSHTDPDREVPFYSDDTYLWLCLEVYPFAQDNERRTKRLVKHRKPNGELNVKYNMHEYRDLWDAVWELRLRLNKLAGSQKAKEKGLKEVSSMDIEKVAFVIRHIRVSGFPVELEEVVEEVIVPPKPEKRSKSKSEGKKDKKRKREDGGEGGEKEKRKKKQRY